MRIFLPLLISILTLSACQKGPSVGPWTYANDPNKRRVMVDEHAIYVVPVAAHRYVAWGGEDDRDGFVQYRQKRAIELVSQCHIAQVTSKKTDALLRASVKC